MAYVTEKYTVSVPVYDTRRFRNAAQAAQHGALSFRTETRSRQVWVEPVKPVATVKASSTSPARAPAAAPAKSSGTVTVVDVLKGQTTAAVGTRVPTPVPASPPPPSAPRSDVEKFSRISSFVQTGTTRQAAEIQSNIEAGVDRHVRERSPPDVLTKQEYSQELWKIQQQYWETGKHHEESKEIQKEISRTTDWHPDTTIKKIYTPEGYRYEVVFPFSGADIYYSTQKEIKRRGFPGLLATAFTPSDPLGLKSAYYTAIGDPEKAWQTKVSAVADTRMPFHEFYLRSPMGVIGATAVTAGTVTAGLGVVTAVSAKAGLGAKVVLASYGTYKMGEYVAPQVKTAMKTGDYGELVGTGATLGLMLPTAIAAGKVGYDVGYGRTGAFLYGRATYKVGSPEYVRYTETLKTVRHLQYVKSSHVKALEITKDVMRLSPSEASKVMGYLKSDPRAVIGGSAAQYAQVKKSLWFKYRDVKPRDIDLLVKDVSAAKQKIGYRLTKASPHKVDIHGFDFAGKPGRPLQFGLRTQAPVKIAGQKYMKLSEQVPRKGISSVMRETQYRWFKDRPDFKMGAEQLISSGKKSFSPVTRFHAYYGGKHFRLVVKPSLASGYGKAPTRFDQLLSRFAKKTYTAPVVSSKGYVYSPSAYIPPVYPMVYSLGYVPSAYSLYVSPRYVAPAVPSYKPVVHASTYTPQKYTPLKYVSPGVPFGYTMPPKSTYIPPRVPSGYTPPYTPPSYTPSVPHMYTPTVQPPPYMPSGYTPTTYVPPRTPVYPPVARRKYPGVPLEDEIKKEKKRTDMFMRDVGYRFRRWKMPSLEKMLKGK